MGVFHESKKKLLLIAGIVFTALGIIGIFVPILPTTPFLLLAAACFVRGSDKFYQWLINNKLLGMYIRNYVEGRGMSFRSKLVTLFLLWGTIILSVTLWVEPVVLKIVLIIIAVSVSVYIYRLKTC